MATRVVTKLAPQGQRQGDRGRRAQQPAGQERGSAVWLGLRGSSTRSHPQTDLNDLIVNNIWASVLSVLIAYLITMLIPDVEARPKPASAPNAPHRMRHEALLGATVATLLACYLVHRLLNRFKATRFGY